MPMIRNIIESPRQCSRKIYVDHQFSTIQQRNITQSHVIKNVSPPCLLRAVPQKWEFAKWRIKPHTKAAKDKKYILNSAKNTPNHTYCKHMSASCLAQIPHSVTILVVLTLLFSACFFAIFLQPPGAHLRQSSGIRASGAETKKNIAHKAQPLRHFKRTPLKITDGSFIQGGAR